MGIDVLAFTDTYFPSINGVTYTIHSWKEEWRGRGNYMGVVYPKDEQYVPCDDEYPVKSLRFPFYDEFQLGIPYLPDDLPSVDIVHLHGQFTLGLAGLWYARKHGVPVVASHHMFGGQYANYLSLTEQMERLIRKAANKYEQKIYQNVAYILAPSEVTKAKLQDTVGEETPVEVLPNGVNLDFFKPVSNNEFRSRYDIPSDRPIVGYTGRQGYEKNLFDIIDAVDEMDLTVVMGGDGPANEELREYADGTDTEVKFLGFIDREELPELYSTLDLFLFPSPVETQGLVALESMCCGTPVIGANQGALADTIDDGTTGYLYESQNIHSFKRSIEKGLRDQASLRSACLDRRDDHSVDAAVNRLESVYHAAVSDFLN